LQLVGREPELAQLETFIGHLSDRGGALVVRSEPGLGKSALLAAAGELADERGVTVLRTGGVPSESHMAFAGLHRLLGPNLAKIADLPGPQARALSSAFGLNEDAAPDLFLTALAALDLLADAAAHAPLLLIVEDVHWLDAATTRVLGFVARRLEYEPIGALFAIREGHPTRLDDANLPEIKLAPLDTLQASDLLDTHAPDLGPARRRQVLDVAGGNPLALLELPKAREPEGVAGASVLTPPPITDTLERAFSERLSDLPEASRASLLVAAADDGGSLNEMLRASSAVVGHPVTADDLAAAEVTGLVQVAPAGLHFRHPLVRAAIYRGATTADRHAAHAALAAAHADDPDRSVWHRAAASAGHDDQVAAELDEAAARALRRGAPLVAAAALERAAQLTADEGARGDHLLQAGEMEFELGRSDLALELLARAKPLVRGERDQARLAVLVEAADEDSWSGPDRVAAFAEIASRMADSEEPEAALRALLTVARSCWWGNPTQQTRDLVVAAAERLAVPPDSPALIAVLACTDPVKRGAAVIERISEKTPDATGDPAAMHMIGTAATTVWAFDTALPFLSASVEGLRAQGRLGMLAQALVSQSWAALHCANGGMAVSAADEAARLARETDQARWAVAADLVRATVAGERGDFDTQEALAEEAEAQLLPIGAQAMLALVQFARGRGAVAHQSYAEGFDQLRRTLDPDDVAYHPFVGSWGLADLVEAAVHTDQRQAAEGYLATLEALAAATPGPLLLAMRDYARPLLAPEDQTERLYLAALGSHAANWPCYRGRLLLGYGQWLRRQRRVAESRAPLRAAREGFDALGFDGLAQRAREELRASGESSGHRAPDLRDQLTPQELQIARHAAEGLSNREIGQRLYLSHRTVGSHLYRIFPKLGIATRGQLAGALAAAESGGDVHSVADR